MSGGSSSTGRFRPILPASSNVPEASLGSGGDSGDPERPSSAVVPKPKRTPVYTACNHCRKRKIKCDGKTPACQRCVSKQLDCEYDIEPDVSRQVSLKRKYEAMQDETVQLKELYRYLVERPEPEAIEILRRIRATKDPAQVLRFIKEGDLLIQGLITGSPREDPDPRVLRLDSEAFRDSAFKVTAVAWTHVAPDGIVSELISSFLAWDQSFYFSFVDKQLFLADLMSEEAQDRQWCLQDAQWCSPLLVNSICALRCFTSDRVMNYRLIEGIDLGQVFFDEARACLDAENGKASIPTIQALLAMYIYCAGQGRDRAGTVFRYTAYEMLQRLRLERRWKKLEENSSDDSLTERMAISRMLWGIFCFESVTAFAYLKPSMVPIPKVPKLLVQDASRLGRNEDVYGNIFAEGSIGPPLTEGHLIPMSELAELLYEIMMLYEKSQSEGNTQLEISSLIELYNKLMGWRSRLPVAFHLEENLTPQTFYLKSFESKVIVSLFRPLEHGFLLPGGLPTAGQLCVSACKQIMGALGQYEERFGFAEYSMLAIYPIYTVSLTLVSRLYDVQTHETFTAACRVIVDCTKRFPFTRYLFKALWALSKELRQNLPPQAAQIFRSNPDCMDIGEADDVPISFVLPQDEEMSRLFSDESDRDLGAIISKYNALTL